MKKNTLYWSMNLPLQVSPEYEDEEGNIIDATILNYMPRKCRCTELNLSDVLGEQTKEEFFESAAVHLENLASLFRKASKGNIDRIYYHDEGMDAVT